MIPFGSELPGVIMMHRFWPSLRIACPLATSYSSPALDASVLSVLMLDNVLEGSTVSHAPESTVISISSHPDSLSLGAMIDIPPGASALVRRSISSLGRSAFISLLPNPIGGSVVMQQLLIAHVIVLFPNGSILDALIVSMYLAQPRIPADEFSRHAGGDDPSGSW